MVNQDADVCAAFLGDLFAIVNKAVDRGAEGSQAVERPWKGLNQIWGKETQAGRKNPWDRPWRA